MARDKLSNFLWHKFLVNFFFEKNFSQLSFFFAHEVCTNHENEDFLRLFPSGFSFSSSFLKQTSIMSSFRGEWDFADLGTPKGM